MCFELPPEHSLVLKKWMILMGYEVELRLCLFGGSIKSWGREEFGRVEGGKERELEKILFEWKL